MDYNDLGNWGDLSIVRVLPGAESEPSNPSCIDPRPIPAEIISIESEIAALSEKVIELTIRRTHLLALRALISTIPAELLSRIFQLAIHETPTLIAQISLVSRSWRGVTLNTPSLWTYIKYDCDWGYSRTPLFLEKTKIQLERSKEAKLLVDIDFRYLDDLGEVHAIMKELEPHLGRCFFFRASVPDWEWMAAVRHHSKLLGNELEELHLRIDPADADEQNPITFLTIPCPRLHTIVLDHTPLSCIRHSESSASTEHLPPSPPVSQVSLPLLHNPAPHLHPALRHLRLVRDQRHHTSTRIGIPFMLLLDTLRTTPTLTSLHIQSAIFLLNGSEPIFTQNPQQGIIVLKELQNLTFNFVDGDNIGLFLESTELPGLKALRIQMDSGLDESLAFLLRVPSRPSIHAPQSTMQSPSQLAFPSLTTLDLRSISSSGPAMFPFMRVLHDLPNLTALALSNPPNGTFGTKLWDTLEQTWVLPSLQALAVQNARDVTGHEVLRVVRARRDAYLRANGLVSSLHPLLYDGEGPLLRQTRSEAKVEKLRYVKIGGCYALDLESDVLDTMKSMVDLVIL